MLPDTVLSSTTCIISVHVPLTLQASTTIPKPSFVRLNNHYLSNPTFLSLATNNWQSVLPSDNINVAALIYLYLWLKRTRAATKKMAKDKKKPNVIVKNCEIVIDFLDCIEEFCSLSFPEHNLRTLVKKSLSHHTSLLATY